MVTARRLRQAALFLWLSGGALAACSSTPATYGFAGTLPQASGDGGHNDGGWIACPRPDAGPPALFATGDPNASAGCGKPKPEDHPLAQYRKHTLSVCDVPAIASERKYYVRLPANYDPNRRYRTVYLAPGCGEPQDDTPEMWKSYPMEQASGDDAIVIAMEPSLYNTAKYGAVPTHYCFDDMAASSVELPYFAALHKQIEAEFCVDRSRQFFAGYSSGGWLAHQLGCFFPDVLRGQASVTGGLPPSIASSPEKCVDHPIAAFLIHDFNDASNVYNGSVLAAERLFKLNRCTGVFSAPTEPSGKTPYAITGVPNTATFNCVSYDSCPAEHPIVFCTSQDQAHGSQEAAAVPGFWEFFARF